LATNTAVVVPRVGVSSDGQVPTKESVPLGSLASGLPARLDAFHDVLVERALAFRAARRAAVDEWPEFAARVAEGFVDAFHCGRPECEDEIKAETTATPRCIPNEAATEEGTCVRCELPSAYGRRIVFARAY